MSPKIARKGKFLTGQTPTRATQRRPGGLPPERLFPASRRETGAAITPG